VSAIAVVSILGYVVRTEAQGDALQNIALGRPYRCSVPVLPGWHGLVDGKCDGDSAPECFATSNVDKFPQYVVIDLGAICEISRVVVYNSANGNTRKVSLECSDDASDYQVLRDGFIFPDKSAMVLSHKFTPRKARYVRLTLHDTWGGGLGGDNCLFLREVEVYGKRTDQPHASGADPLVPFKGQEMTIEYRSLRIFRRYCLGNPALPLRVAVVGDGFGMATPGQAHWTTGLFERLERRWGRAPQIENLASKSFVAEDCRALFEGSEQQPDLVLLTMGYSAALGRTDAAQFRQSTVNAVSLLTERTDALVVLVTPPPIVHQDSMGLYQEAIGADSATCAWQVETLASEHKLPLVRTGAVLANSSYDVSDLYADNLHLSDRGHEMLAIVIDRLLAGP
jgi:hypothetical protein